MKHRNTLIAVVLLLAFGMVLAACGGAVPEAPAAEEPAAEAPAEEAAPMAGEGGKEAPMLAEMVAAGDLPPLEEHSGRAADHRALWRDRPVWRYMASL